MIKTGSAQKQWAHINTNNYIPQDEVAAHHEPASQIIDDKGNLKISCPMTGNPFVAAPKDLADTLSTKEGGKGRSGSSSGGQDPIKPDDAPPAASGVYAHRRVGSFVYEFLYCNKLTMDLSPVVP